MSEFQFFESQHIEVIFIHRGKSPVQWVVNLTQIKGFNLILSKNRWNDVKAVPEIFPVPNPGSLTESRKNL